MENNISQQEQQEQQQVPKSKNQIKRELKNAQLREKKQQKKLLKKQLKQEKQNLNSEKQNEQQQQKQQEDVQSDKIKPHIQKYLENMKNGTKVIIDMQFQEILTHQEIASMREQIILSYGLNKKLEQPLNYQVTSVPEDSRLKQLINTNEKHKRMKIDFQDKSYLDLYDKDKLIYLTGDSQEEMENLENDKIYIIGGIVDHNRLKNCTLNKAQEQGIKTQRLPLNKYIKLFSSQILNVNHVFAILAKLQNGQEWKMALEETIPQRKQKHHREMYEQRLQKRLKTNDEDDNNGDANDKIENNQVEQIQENQTNQINKD